MCGQLTCDSSSRHSAMHVAGAVPASRAVIARPHASRVRPSVARRALALRRRSTEPHAVPSHADDAPDSPDTTWRVRQVFGEGKVLLDQLREVADLLADGFNASGRSSRDLLNGLVQKVRWSGGDFVCLVADDGGEIDDGGDDDDDKKRESSEKNKKAKIVGACDLTLLPAGGKKKSKEGLVGDVPAQLGLNETSHFLYLTGMVVPTEFRRMGIGDALLGRCKTVAKNLTDKKPKCVALHVADANAPAIGLYLKNGFVTVEDLNDGTGAGDAASEKKDLQKLFNSFPLNFPSGSDFGFGKKAASRNETLMVFWLADDTEKEQGKGLLIDE